MINSMRTKFFISALLLLIAFSCAQPIEEFTLDSKNPTALIELPFNEPQVHVPELLNSEQIKCIETTIGSNPKDSTYSSVLIELNPLCQFLGKAKIKITNPKDSQTINKPLEYIISIPFKPDVLIVSNAEKLTPDVNFYDALQKYLLQVNNLGLSYKYLEIGGRKGSYKFDSDEYSLFNVNYQPVPLTEQTLNVQVSGFVQISEPKILLILGGYSFILPRTIRNEATVNERGGVVLSDDLIAPQNKIGQVPKVVVARISTSSIDTTPIKTITTFLKNNANVAFNDPQLIIGVDPDAPALTRNGLTIQQKLQGITTCNADQNCYLAPPFCAKSQEYTDPSGLIPIYTQKCDQNAIQVVKNANLLILQTHGTSDAILDRHISTNEGKKYATLFEKEEIIQGQTKFIVGEQCYATLTLEDPENLLGRVNSNPEEVTETLANYAVQKSSTIIGKNAVSAGTYTDKLKPGKKLAFNLLLEAKKAILSDQILDQRQKITQAAKLHLIGNPFAVVDLQKSQPKVAANTPVIKRG